jgi:hypothetical protein
VLHRPIETARLRRHFKIASPSGQNSLVSNSQAEMLP